MKLLFIKKGFIYFYFFILISLHSFIYSDATINYNYAKLDKYKSYQLYSSSYNYFFLDIASFEGEDYLYFKLEINYGTFSYEYMNYEIYSSIPPNPSTPKKVQYCSRDYNYDSYYERYIYYYYYYKIPKPKNGYIIILPPTFSTTSGNAFIINLKNNNFECKGITISNYYLDGETGLYKNCYTKCKKCYEGGTIDNNNCDECKEGNILLNEPLGYEKNCFSKCPYYYYFIENNKPEKYTCTSSKSCPPNYKLITQKNKCIDECKNDKDNKYIFECISGCDSQCVEKCPTDLKIDYEEKKCLISCTINKFEYMNTCLTDCPSWTYKIYTDRNRCFEKLPENYYLDSTTGIYKICHENCKRCSSYGDNNNNNCDECKNGYIFLNEPLIKEKNCVLKCNGYYYFDGRNKYTCASSCPITYKKIIPKKKCIDKCINDIDGKYIFEYNNECVDKCPFNVKIDYEDKKCLESCYDYKFEYMNTCLTNCPEETYKIFTDRYRCTKILPINFFYLEEETQIYKPCFESCLKCYGEGNIINNNCIKCKKDFIPLNEPYKDKNCFSCKYNYYINDEGSYFCTENSNCPTKYNKLIKEQKKCIKKCIKDNTYKYNYNNICLQNCPNNTYYTNENKICYDNSYPKELAAENEIIYSRECLTSGECKDMNYTVEIGNVTIQITNSEIQNNYIEGNFSKIDLDGCEGKLRSIYEINKDIPLLIFKVDYYKNDSLIPIIEYEIYNPKNLSILDLSYCINNNNNTINIFIPVSIDEKVLFKYDPNSDYYTNSCYSYTTENGTDIILKDRQKEYINNNMRVCEKKCKFIKYDPNYKQSLCKCDIKKNMEKISILKNDENEIVDEFSLDDDESNDSSSSSMVSIECTYVLFTVNGIKTNISSYLLLAIITYFLFSIIYFVKCGLPKLKSKIKNIINFKQTQNNQITSGNI